MKTSDVDYQRHRGPMTPDREALVRAEQIRAQYRNMPGAFIGSALIATLIATMFYDRVGPAITLAWLAAAYANSGLRFWLWKAFYRTRPENGDMRRWGRYVVAFAALAGVVWGTAGIVMHVPGSLSHQIFVLIVTTGLAFSSTYISAPFLPGFIAFVYPAFLLSAVPFLRDGDVVHVVMGIATIAFLPLLTRYAAGLSRAFLSSIDVRLRNAELVVELRAQKQAAEEANVAKSRFLAVASHDLRQPLHALGLFVEALQECPLSTQERQLVGNVRRSVDAMEELFDALLDISRLDAGAVRPRTEAFPLAMIFDRLRFEYAAVAQRKGLTFKVLDSSLYVRSDSTLLGRIVRNLVANAVRYTEQGSIVLGCRRDGDNVRIEVWDTGPGIPADKHCEVFQEFTQLDNPERDRRKGLGLGLAIVQRLARLLGHDVALRSEVGKGSVFSVTVPRGRKEDHVPVDRLADIKAAFDLAGVLVLVIDNEPAVRQATEALLSRWNCSVVTASSGSEMRTKLPTLDRTPDFIISDYRLRGDENGLEVVEMLRDEFNSDVPALLVTGDTGADRPPESDAGGFVTVLHKPLNPARLRTLMINLLRAPAPPARRSPSSSQSEAARAG